jgi:hypothetical protein
LLGNGVDGGRKGNGVLLVREEANYLGCFFF